MVRFLGGPGGLIVVMLLSASPRFNLFFFFLAALAVQLLFCFSWRAWQRVLVFVG
jgi:hypothetical protein